MALAAYASSALGAKAALKAGTGCATVAYAEGQRDRQRRENSK